MRIRHRQLSREIYFGYTKCGKDVLTDRARSNHSYMNEFLLISDKGQTFVSGSTISEQWDENVVKLSACGIVGRIRETGGNHDKSQKSRSPGGTSKSRPVEHATCRTRAEILIIWVISVGLGKRLGMQHAIKRSFGRMQDIMIRAAEHTAVVW